MRSIVRLAVSAVVVVGVLLAPVPLDAWAMDVHRLITRRAIAGLPPPLLAFFAAKADFVAEHSADPDLWRPVGLKSEFGEEDPNHFLDIDMFGDAPPFASIPRDWKAMVEKYGLAKANQVGRLPWRVEEIYGRLVTTFQDMGKGTYAYAGDNARYLAAVLAHYVEDAHVPFHSSANYDGQLTNQRGIHARFEGDVVLKNRTQLVLTPVTIKPIANIRDFIFDTLIESQALVAPVLAADLKAAQGRDAYDDAYFAALFAGVRPIAEKRYSGAASAVTSAIVSAWEKAGKPAPRSSDDPKPPVKIKR